MPALEAIVIYIDPFVARDEGTVDAVNTLESKTELIALPLNLRQSFGCPVDIDKIDRHGL
ncbi:hypothetical protein FHT85_000949 [Rhizobium sp. BK312]|uniref:Uncharacterized protein n=1 Tax=Rhizobium miluonense TaxID=411945 RepID=A0ABU1SNY3_9HYPH|nr:hypothetical protein [Rhizobium sp. BK312]MDR6900644.1 hypothetical protein [Rhizobium miluonense]